VFNTTAIVFSVMLRMKTILVGLGAIVIAAGTLAAFYYFGVVRFSYPDSKAFPVRGIDVSHHQGRIEWNHLPAQGIRFAYLKASEGADWSDPLFAKNLAAAPSDDFLLGAYHYFTFCASGSAQAANFIRNVPLARQLKLPPAVDVEYVGNCAARPSREAFARELRTFLLKIEARYHVTPVLYTTKNFYTDYLSGDDFATYPLWARDIFGEPSWVSGRPVIFHQFADNARMAGVTGPVDLNVYVGSQKQFDARFDPGVKGH
jgi:lysozyme